MKHRHMQPDLTEYKAGRGTYIPDRVNDIAQLIKRHYDVTSVTEQDGVYRAETSNPALKAIYVTIVDYDGKKARLGVDWVTADPRDDSVTVENMKQAREAKNELLRDATERTVDNRTSSIKRRAKQ